MNIYETLLERLDGHIYNGYFAACCVFHNDTNPSMFVYEDGFYTCKSCGAKGSLAKLNRHLGGKSVNKKSHIDTVLPQWRRWEENFGDITGIAKHAHLSLKRYPQWNFYFKQRKIEQFIEQGYFGYIDGWVTFPVFDQEHKIQNIVVRNTKNVGTRYAIKATDEKKPLLYCPNWKRISENDTIYVVYGLIDSWAFEAIDLPCVTGITGKSLSAELLKPLGKKFVIVPDEWEERDARLLANSLGWRGRMQRILYPEGVKDPDGIRTKFGNEYFANVIGA